MRAVSTSEEDFADALAAYEGGSLQTTRERLHAFLVRSPAHVPALMLAGVVAAQLLELEAALECFERVLALEPDNASARFNKAGVLLVQGDWARGLPLYESRWQLTELCSNRPATRERPAWRGAEPLDGKSILLRCEQGLGDTLQFCRYVPLVAERAASVVVEAQRPLLTLLADLPGISRIVTQAAPLPACDYECPLMSLPLAFGTTPDTIPWPTAYLRSDPTKVAEWRARLGSATGLRIGLAWRGTATRAHERRRSVPLQLLLEHLPPEHQYFSLQKELSADESQLLRRQPLLTDHSAEQHDFSDIAALCACLDLVISVDTSLAHLSAGLGRPTWILLPYSPSWRWLLNRLDSPWYRCAVLFRQTRVDDWRDVCACVAARLRTSVAFRTAVG